MGVQLWLELVSFISQNFFRICQICVLKNTTVTKEELFEVLVWRYFWKRDVMALYNAFFSLVDRSIVIS